MEKLERRLQEVIFNIVNSSKQNVLNKIFLLYLMAMSTVVSGQLAILNFLLCAQLLLFLMLIQYWKISMDLSPFRQNFEKNRNRQKYHHSLKEHPTFSKIAKFGCKML